jgi:diadenosine tetraphosphatase ApaH/serine/threonine PP2A family protein phosphatase
MARILIISDIHSNLEALEACLQAAPHYDSVWNLGDLVGYGASPNEVIAAAQKIGKRFVRGNHDKACSGITQPNDFNIPAATSVLWTREHLTPHGLEWLRELPAGPLSCDGHTAQIAHGSPLDEDHYLLDIIDACQVLNEGDVQLTFFGHTHVQGGFAEERGKCYRIDPQYDTLNGFASWDLELSPQSMYLINPGSVGQPRDGDPRSAFCIWNTNERRVTYYRVDYDLESAQKRIRDAGLPRWHAERLSQGR